MIVFRRSWSIITPDNDCYHKVIANFETPQSPWKEAPNKSSQKGNPNQKYFEFVK